MVLDYEAVDSEYNYTFQSGETYYVNGVVYLSGLTTIEGGAVIKYETNYAFGVSILGTIQCATSPDHPAILTYAGDNSVGDLVPAGDPPNPPDTGILNITFNYDPAYWGTIGFSIFEYEGDSGDIYDGETSGSGSDSFSIASTGFPFYIWAPGSGYSGWSQIFYPTTDHGVLALNDSGYWSYFEALTVGLSLANGGSLNNLVIRNLNTGVQERCSLFSDRSAVRPVRGRV